MTKQVRISLLGGLLMLFLLVALYEIYSLLDLGSQGWILLIFCLIWGLVSVAVGVALANRTLHHQSLYREGEDRFLALIERIPECVFLMSIPDRRLLKANAAFRELLGYSLTQVTQMTIYDLAALDRDAINQQVQRTIGIKRNYLGSQNYRKKDGSVIGVEVAVDLVSYRGQDTLCYVVFDTTERRQANEKIQILAYSDSLTGLPNRVLFQDRLKLAMAQADRHDRRLALLFLDLDNFKNINDTLGHSIGDQLLKSVADRLKDLVRETDTIARFGGDEFILMIGDVARQEDLARAAERIMERIRPPFVFSGYEVITTGSIGIVFYPDDGKDMEALLRNVDTAMYNAKGQGRNNFQFYNRSMNLKLADLLVLKNGLVHALERKEFVAFFQPQYRIGDGELIGAEALIRWVHPDRGLVSPDLFISLAEETGLIVPIGQQMLRTACHQWRNWQASVLEMTVAVNLSAREFRQENLVSIVAGILKDTGLKPSLLEIEITESSAMQNVEFTKRLLDELKEMGIKIAIDDFGTGYSSLSYLTRFPIDTVKVDRSFIKEILNDRRTAAIVSGIIALAHSLEFSVIAEGVDKPEQLAWLEQEGCDKVQGFLFSPPIPASLFGERLLRTKTVGTDR